MMGTSRNREAGKKIEDAATYVHTYNTIHMRKGEKKK